MASALTDVVLPARRQEPPLSVLGIVIVHTSETADRLRSRVSQRLFWAQVAALGSLAAFMIASQRYLFADGAFFHWLLLESRSIFQWYPARQFSHLLTQWPTIAVMKGFDCHDLTLLSTIYGATQFLVPVAGLLAVAWAGRKAPAHFLLMPLLCVSILTMTTSCVIMHEAWVSVPLFWLILYLLLFSDRMTWLRGVVLIAASILVTRTFESYLFLSIVVLFAAALRLRTAWLAGRRFDVAVCGVAALASIVGAMLAAHEFLHPRDPKNRVTFLSALWSHLDYSPVWLTLGAFLAFVVLALAPARLVTNRTATLVLAFLGASAILVGLIPFIAPCWIEPGRQYVSRPQFLYVPFVLGALSLGLAHAPARFAQAFSERGRWLEALVAGMTASAFLFHWGATMEWNGFRKSVLEQIEPAHGVLAHEDSVLNAERTMEESSSRRSRCQSHFQWGWTNPVFTAYLGAREFGRVRTVIANRPGATWEPFDPHRKEPYEWMREYGIAVEIFDAAPPSKPDAPSR